MNPWDIFTWAVAISSSLAVIALTIGLVVALLKPKKPSNKENN